MPKIDPWVGSAVFSDTDISKARYRYRLTRAWGTGQGRICFIMLNPSTATADISDPTVRRCEKFARRWKFAVLNVVNIFAIRSTNPRALYGAVDPVGPENDSWICKTASDSDLVIAAWGVHGVHMGRGKYVADMVSKITQLRCLGQTKEGFPRHPLYLRADAKAVNYA